jgi:hypothetical protein
MPHRLSMRPAGTWLRVLLVAVATLIAASLLPGQAAAGGHGKRGGQGIRVRAPTAPRAMTTASGTWPACCVAPGIG